MLRTLWPYLPEAAVIEMLVEHSPRGLLLDPPSTNRNEKRRPRYRDRRSLSLTRDFLDYLHLASGRRGRPSLRKGPPLLSARHPRASPRPPQSNHASRSTARPALCPSSNLAFLYQSDTGQDNINFTQGLLRRLQYRVDRDTPDSGRPASGVLFCILYKTLKPSFASCRMLTRESQI